MPERTNYQHHGGHHGAARSWANRATVYGPLYRSVYYKHADQHDAAWERQRHIRNIAWAGGRSWLNALNCTAVPPDQTRTAA